MKLKKVGIIGCGARGLHHIGFNMVDQRDECGLEISAVANRSKESSDYAAGEIQKRYSGQGNKAAVRSCREYEEMLEDVTIDLIIITSHTDAHREHALAAL